MQNALIVGGTGFIGTAFLSYLQNKNIYNKIFLFDAVRPNEITHSYRKSILNRYNNIEFRYGDVNSVINIFNKNDNIKLIANFAAVHREPGHLHGEYFETNINGSENICKLAEEIDCNSIIFTSSISPYGISSKAKDENSTPEPITAYGSSKLVAEKIHQIWQSTDRLNRKLVIVRPGVVFGPGEGGNVTRLIKAVKGRYFCFLGNRNTRKAGTYVYELCNAMYWALDNLHNNEDNNFSLFNMTLDPPPSVEDYVNAICNVLNRKIFIPSVPVLPILMASHIINNISKVIKFNHPFNPVRVNKTIRSNKILPTYLLQKQYKYIYTLETSMKDWKNKAPEDW